MLRNYPTLKPFPRWSSWAIPTGFWMTLAPIIYHPRDVDPSDFPSIILHEQVHLRQQASGLLWWLLRYVISRKFRLKAEAEAYAVEINSLPLTVQAARLVEAGKMLSGSLYFRCASDPLEAESRINEWLQRMA